MVATYQVAALDGSYTNIVAKIVPLRYTSCTPHPDSLGIHHRSLWSVEYEAVSPGVDDKLRIRAETASRQ
jgi:hypothetical protein